MAAIGRGLAVALAAIASGNLVDLTMTSHVHSTFLLTSPAAGD